MIGLDSVVGVLIGAVPGRRQQLLEHRRVRRGPVGDHLDRHHLRRADRPLEEPTSGRRIPPHGEEHIDDLAELIDRSIHIPPAAGDLHVGLIHPPAISHGMPARAGGFGQQGREPLHPPVDSDVVDIDPALGEQLLNVAVGQTEAQVPADRQHNHVGREAEAGEGRSRNRSRTTAASPHTGSLAAQTRSTPMQQSHQHVGPSSHPAGAAAACWRLGTAQRRDASVPTGVGRSSARLRALVSGPAFQVGRARHSARGPLT